MKINKIKQLRMRRVDAEKNFNKKLEEVRNNPRFSSEYKKELEDSIKNEAIKTISDYDKQITNLFNEYEAELFEGYVNAEFSGIDKDQIGIELLKEMRNGRLADVLIHEYKEAPDALYNKAKELIVTNSPYVPAYIHAMKMLDDVRVIQLEQDYHEQSMNNAQRAYKSDLDNLRKAKKEYEVEKLRSSDPLSAALLQAINQGKEQDGPVTLMDNQS